MTSVKDIIVKRGIIVNKTCLRCNKDFEIEEGIITIKGIIPFHYFCKKCDKIILEEISRAYEEYMKNGN
jgi:hypothetical protein